MQRRTERRAREPLGSVWSQVPGSPRRQGVPPAPSCRAQHAPPVPLQAQPPDPGAARAGAQGPAQSEWCAAGGGAPRPYAIINVRLLRAPGLGRAGSLLPSRASGACALAGHALAELLVRCDDYDGAADEALLRSQPVRLSAPSWRCCGGLGS